MDANLRLRLTSVTTRRRAVSLILVRKKGSFRSRHTSFETLASRPRSLQQSTAAWRSALRSRLTSFRMCTSAVHQTTGSRHFMETSCSPTTPTSSPLRLTPQPAGRPSKPDRLAEGASGLSAGQSRRAAASAERPARLRRPEGPTRPTSTLMQPKRRMLQPDESCNNDFGWWGGNSGSDS